jgi:glutathione S-transferase
MPGLVLYDNPRSSNALKVRFLLSELGLAHERRTIDLARPRPEGYLALNPVGGIPTLDDDGFVLAESHAILRYLATREGRGDLLPADPFERARIDEFLDRLHTGIRAAFFRHEVPALGYSRDVGGWDAVPRDPEAAARVAVEIRPTLELLDDLVSPGGAVLGRFTIADCALAPVLHRTLHTGLDLSPFPTLTALRAALTTRPSFLAADPVG